MVRSKMNSGKVIRRSLPIHRRLLLRKVDLWTRSKPIRTPQFLEVVSEGMPHQFDVPIEGTVDGGVSVMPDRAGVT